ncbi:accessory Sec system protein Asp2 [Limosilactobacillus caecicola]|uniref:accessory Sec system protein Asp2 n=1 Tax=Limosilactobacillus caecicola TaxID=2941332 RepID=UPI00203B3067|nr:accessory Sec system protein Asp2 [Limosilactobacillus caecicola]
MNVLQIGPQNWAEQYEMPKDMKWEFNSFPPKKKHGYNVVIVTGKNSMSDQDWQKLQWLVDPYNVICTTTDDQLTAAAEAFLEMQAAFRTTDDPTTIIANLPRRYFWGQSGLRISPVNFRPILSRLQSYEMTDAGHINMQIDTPDRWMNVGTYKSNIYLDPNRLINFWLEYQAQGVEVRLRLFIQATGGDGDPNDSFTINLDSLDEVQLPIEFVDYPRYVSVCLEVKGHGEVRLGTLHSRWGREGNGEFLAGGQRIVDPEKREDVAIYFNPGDLRPPLNVYFSGARSLEGFEAYPMFRGMKSPAILVTDMRLEVGQFYTNDYIESKIKETICHYLDQLGFDRSQLIMNGISMGTYPAIKLGAQLGAYAIMVAKPLTNLGLIAKRGRLERPYGFETIYDVDNQLIPQLDYENLDKLDEDFWAEFDQCDLSKTRLFVGYMIDDDYDNQAISHFQKSPAVAKAREFVIKGFPGHHNDDPSINYWFAGCLAYVMQHDFGREY